MSTLILEHIEIPLIAAVNLQIAAGECISLMGASGCGKSLLLRAIADLDPNGGDARIDDKLRSRTPAPQWRKRVALLPTETQWWHNTVGQHFHNSKPAYIDTLGFSQDVMNWQTDRLSTGEKQRLGILRLLDLKPDALLLDEPTASLDDSNKQVVEMLLKQYRQDNHAAAIWVTHDEEQATRIAERHFHIADRELTEVQ